jgi:hypothetical protein
MQVKVMRYRRLLLLALLLQPCLAFSASKTCPKVSDYECLVKNSLQVYREDHDHWWDIYNYTAEKAKTCKSFKDVTLFLRLWSGETDGEMAEGLDEDTEEILVKNGKCFFEGMLGLADQERAALLSRFCPPPVAPVLKPLKQAAKNPRYKSVAPQLLARIDRPLSPPAYVQTKCN